MRYGEWVERQNGAPLADPLDLVGPGGLVVIAPHPDDESIGASTMIAATAASDRSLGLVAVTDGEGSHRGSPSWSAPRIAERRRAEQAAAMGELGADRARVLRLALPDGGSRWADGFDGAARRVAEFCAELGATALLTTPVFDPHPDHEAAAELGARVQALLPQIRLLLYPVWSLRHGNDDDVPADALHPFRLAAPLDAKRRAIARHETQNGGVIHDDPTRFALPDWFLAHHLSGSESVFWSPMPGSPPGAEHFSRLYRGGRDFWGVRDQPYEVAKREAAAAFLGDWRGARGQELGCGEGFLAARLLGAGAVREMLGIDLDPTIIERANQTHGSLPGARFRQGRMPDDFPDDPFDLLVVSEMLYFLNEPEIADLVERMSRRARPGARCLLVNYLGPTETPLGGDAAADFLRASASGRWRPLRSERRPDGFRLDLLERCA
ncbi:bifunctional PIG-L family deacetylase/class I SAM-dependent methyltransferase [Aureimonas jatrophae]|uniref:N-acetylglucosaminyl deacetylase, LmbE family n=1 Tax=Aureimonas jatrophae TaxID=1166073 RepID=A0A1H0ERD4_9HYPH|nr:bifunctional PIG-L family deacetylase/class I SAM-dependent methyltransferase [Aureimonas jatrophae]MBB3950355.1 LmbE family N-acetylglucosaminyl deacetylase [Aureimonas jatrophae]SDN84863.1 N-acetylglucosaminyl deacetylase, LmbE family [Aureimonas jatrophae]